MDPNRFDALTRIVGSGQSRRRVLKTLAGGALAAVSAAIGLDDARAAAKKRAMGVVCSKNADCQSNACLPKDRSGHRYCGCGSPKECPQATGQCQAATCTAGVCGIGVTVNAACTDGNACTRGETCQANGVCGGGTAIVCPKPDQCHDAGTCDPNTGQCSNPAKSDGAPCDDGDACTTGDVCAAGVCGGVTVACLVGDVCAAGACTCQAGDTLSPVKSCHPSAPCDLFPPSNCACNTDTDGVTGCWDYCVSCEEAARCTSTADCAAFGADAVCVSTEFCEGDICVLPCGGGGIAGGTSIASAALTNPLGPA